MYRHFLVEQGIELELDAEIVDVVDFIDKNISTFTCGEHGFKISSGKGVVNAQWKLLVRPRELMNPKVQKDPIGCIMVERMEGSMTRLTIPPREQYGEDGGSPTELESKLFLSFICQILNRLQDRGFIELPGFVPVE